MRFDSIDRSLDKNQRFINMKLKLLLFFILLSETILSQLIRKKLISSSPSPYFYIYSFCPIFRRFNINLQYRKWRHLYFFDDKGNQPSTSSPHDRAMYLLCYMKKNREPVWLPLLTQVRSKGFPLIDAGSPPTRKSKYHFRANSRARIIRA